MLKKINFAMKRRICEICEQELGQSRSCVPVPVFLSGQLRYPAPFDAALDDTTSNNRCSSCGVVHAGYHHPMCGSERCPICDLFFDSCECDSEADDFFDFESGWK